MKTVIAFIISISLAPLICAGNNVIDGTYVSSEYMKLVLDNYRFQIIRLGTGHGLWGSDEIIAEGKYSMIKSDLLEFNSDDSSSYESVASSKNVDYIYAENTGDSIEVDFVIPSNQNLSIEISPLIESKEGEFYDVELNYVKNKSHSVIIPYPYELLVSIKSGIGIQTNWLPTLCYQGVPEILVYCHVPKNCSMVRISMPGLTDNFFSRLFLKGEYALISEDTIRFKGVEFVKAHE